MVHDRTRARASTSGKWKICHDAIRSLVTPLSFRLHTGFYERRDTRAREWGDRRRYFLSRAHANERANITHGKSSTKLNAFQVSCMRLKTPLLWHNILMTDIQRWNKSGKMQTVRRATSRYSLQISLGVWHEIDIDVSFFLCPYRAIAPQSRSTKLSSFLTLGRGAGIDAIEGSRRWNFAVGQKSLRRGANDAASAGKSLRIRLVHQLDGSGPRIRTLEENFGRDTTTCSCLHCNNVEVVLDAEWVKASIP